MKLNFYVFGLTTLVAIQLVTASAAAERVIQLKFAGCKADAGQERKAVSVSGNTKVKSVIFIAGDRINGIKLRGGDNNDVVFKGSKGAPELQPISLAEDEYLVGFQGVCSVGKDKGLGAISIPVRGGWFKAQAVISGPNGKRYSDILSTNGLPPLAKFGITGPPDIKLLGKMNLLPEGASVFEILAPEGHEVVGLHGRAGDVLDYVGLITQMR